MPNDFQHWRSATNNYNPESEPSVVLPEEARFGKTSIQPSVPVPQSGRIRGAEKEYGKKFPQFEDIHGRPFVHPVAPKRPEITLASIKADLERTYNELIEAQEHYEANKDVIDDRADRLNASIADLERQLAERKAELEKVIAEGTVAQKVTRALSMAERVTSAIVSNTVDASAAVDAKATFRCDIKKLDEGVRKSLGVRHREALQSLLSQNFIKLSGTEKLNDSQIAQHLDRVIGGINKLGEYITGIEEQAK
jgi:hypothetical protein